MFKIPISSSQGGNFAQIGIMCSGFASSSNEKDHWKGSLERSLKKTLMPSNRQRFEYSYGPTL